jgi:guanine deaminase
MNANCPPEYIEASTEKSLEDTIAIIKYCESLDTDIVYPIITPRFAISCSSDLLKSLGNLAQETGTAIQTHISENRGEIEFTKELFPDCESYTHVYDSHGLLRHNTILAHAVHLTEEEMDLVKARNAGISHCPTSNFNLNSGCAKVGRLMDKGIKVGWLEPESHDG